MRLRLGEIKKVIENNGKSEFKNYPKTKQPIIQQAKSKPPNCHSCKRNSWLDFDEGYYCQKCEIIIHKQKHQIVKKVLRQDHYFSTTLSCAKKKIRKSWMNMINTS